MRFYVYRHGSNAANQSMTQTMLVAEVEAADAEEAKQLAAKRVTVYNNQHLSAEDADAEDAREAAIDAAVKIVE